MHSPARHGFTLIEILVAMAIIGILAALIIIAINPSKQLNKARNAARHVDINTIANGVYQYAIDTHFLPDTIPYGTGALAGEKICQSTYVPVDNTECVNLRTLSGTYLVSIPIDPLLVKTQTGYTGYTISEIDNAQIWVYAPYAMNEPYPEDLWISR